MATLYAIPAWGAVRVSEDAKRRSRWLAYCLAALAAIAFILVVTLDPNEDPPGIVGTTHGVALGLSAWAVGRRRSSPAG